MLRSRRARRSSLLEGLEARVVFNAAYKVIADGGLAQDWTNVNLITVDDDWSNVPSIVGYRGDDITTAVAADPATLTAFAGPAASPVPVIDVNANKAVTFTTGGVTEVDTIANPVVGVIGSATADAPFLNFYINTTASGAQPVQTSIPMSFTVRDLTTGTTDAIQKLAVQYRLNDTSAYTTIPSSAYTAGYLTDYSVPNGTLDTNVSLTLPAAVENQATVQIRIITANATGTDELLGIDSIRIGSATPKPVVYFSNPTYSVTEGDTGTTNATVTITREFASGTTTVDYATTATGNATANTDYTPVTGSVTFTGSQTSASFTVPIIGDTTTESAETIGLQISNVSAGSELQVPNTATLTILDNDVPPPAFLVFDEVKINPASTADEPHEYLEIRGPAGATLSNVSIVTLEGDATAGGTASGTVDFAFSLNGVVVGSNGLILVKSAAYTPTVDAGTTVVNSALFDTVGGTLENEGTVTYSLLFSSVTFVVGTDYDPTNGGALSGDITSATVLDSFSFTDGGATDSRYLNAPLLTRRAGCRHTIPREYHGKRRNGVLLRRSSRYRLHPRHG